MYPPNHRKAPPVRPRSSLSTDRIRDMHHHSRKRSNAILTLACFCVFLFILCAFLLGALVYVGKRWFDEKVYKRNITADVVPMQADDFYLAGSINQPVANPNNIEEAPLFLSTKPLPRLRPATNVNPVEQTISATTDTILLPETMNGSKVLSKLNFRLPKELRPKHYRLRLQPDLGNKTFAGSVFIRLQVLEPISFIPVHIKQLGVRTVEVLRVSENGTKLANVPPRLSFEHPDLEYWVTEFEQPLDAGEYQLQLEFEGSLTNRIVGFYQSSYLDTINNETRWLATSKFEPTYARMAFPCFDEPAMKAVFQITVVRPTGDNYHALSNMNVEQETVLGDVTEVNFAESVPMSTYLACFIVSDLQHESKTVQGSLENAPNFEMRVFSTAAQIQNVKYALNTGVAVIEYYIKFFGIAYPLPKLDMAAVPDFVSGAMEHWGLVTFRETALLYDEQTSSSKNKQRVATVVAHELAHMWFGNLVTMRWWNDLWLNEGFATFLQYKSVNVVHPEWQMLDQFLPEVLHSVLELDETLAAHPIVQTVENPDQITEIFDSITYSKGASIVRMLEDLVGETKFRSATTNYLNKFRYQNAETDDFLTEIEKQNFDFDVKLIMQTWTLQQGLPVVEVSRDGNVYKLTQKRFFSNPADYNIKYNDSRFNYRWTIPITFFTSSNVEVQRQIFNYNDQELTITLPSEVDWIKINKNQIGYYRVNYAADIWVKLIKALTSNKDSFSISDRAHLLNDVFALANAGQLRFGIALDLSTYLEQELEYVPWAVTLSQLSKIMDRLFYTDLYTDFRWYGHNLLKSVTESISWNSNDNQLQNHMRGLILSYACKFGVSSAVKEAGARFRAWLENPVKLPDPNVRLTVYSCGMRLVGDEKIWQKVWELFLAETQAIEKLNLMEALSGIKDPWILQRFINLAWNDSYVRGQDYFTCLQYIATNPSGTGLVWDYVRENWPKLVSRFGLNERYLGNLIPNITERFATRIKLEEMEAFFARYPEAGAGTAARKRAIEKVKRNIKWLDANKEQIGNWLSEKNNKTSNNISEQEVTVTV